MIQVEIDVPHIFETGGQRFRASNLECRVELVTDHDGWAIDDTEVNAAGDDGKWRWVRLSKDDALRASILCEAYGPSRAYLDEQWTDFITDGGWKAAGEAA